MIPWLVVFLLFVLAAQLGTCIGLVALVSLGSGIEREVKDFVFWTNYGILSKINDLHLNKICNKFPVFR